MAVSHVKITSGSIDLEHMVAKTQVSKKVNIIKITLNAKQMSSGITISSEPINCSNSYEHRPHLNVLKLCSNMLKIKELLENLAGPFFKKIW